jgi:UDP-glucose 4-epimerase
VRILDNLITGFENNVSDGAELLKGDLRKEYDVEEACRDIDIVFDQEAVRGVRRSVDEPLLTLECNVRGTLLILLAAVDGDVARVAMPQALTSMVTPSARPISRRCQQTPHRRRQGASWRPRITVACG